MTKSNFLFKPVIYIVLAVYFVLAYPVLGMGNNFIAATIPEDHYFEIVGAFSLLATSMLFLYGFRLARKSLEKTWFSLIKQLVYLGLAALFFFGAGEEISWGQRILGFQTPESLTEVNRQEEFNVHNLTVLETNKLLDADRLFDMFWFLFAVFTPALALVVPPFRRFAGRFIPIVYWGIGLLFLYNYLWAKLAKVIFRTAYTFERIPFAQAIQEIKESNYAILFILVGLHAIWELRQASQEHSVPANRGAATAEPGLPS